MAWTRLVAMRDGESSQIWMCGVFVVVAIVF